jgi:hypothetical protein
MVEEAVNMVFYERSREESLTGLPTRRRPASLLTRKRSRPGETSGRIKLNNLHCFGFEVTRRVHPAASKIPEGFGTHDFERARNRRAEVSFVQPHFLLRPVHQNTQAVNRLAEIVLPRGLQFVVDCPTLLSLQVSASNFPGVLWISERRMPPFNNRSRFLSITVEAAQFFTDRLGFTNDCRQDPVLGRFAYTKQ